MRRHRTEASAVRPLLLLVLVAAPGPALAWAARPALAAAARGGPQELADLVAAGCAGLGLVAWVWLTAGVVACWLSARRGSGTPPAWAPRIARVLVAASLGVGLPALEASAETLPTSSPPAGTAVTAELPVEMLRGLRLPDRALGTPHARSAQPASRARAAVPVRVRPGDCLWDLAEEHLPGPASAAEVDRAWRLLYRANRPSVGPDPDVLRPGTRLVLPLALVRAPRPGETR